MSTRKTIAEACKRLISDQRKFSERSGVSQPTVSRFMNGKMGGENLIRVLEALGARITFPDEASLTREIHFVDVKSPLPDGEIPVAQENYTAVPLLSDVGAGPGIIRNEYEYEAPREWFMVNRGSQSMLGRQVDKLYAVRIDARSTSMEPTLHPGDTVLVDPTDKRVDRPGGIFLVMDPGPDSGGKIKRVNVERVPARNLTRLTFYSDNVQEYPPEVHILEHDYDNDLSRAIAGRVIWAWTDLSKK